jgi:hypothetical protein
MTPISACACIPLLLCTMTITLIRAQGQQGPPPVDQRGSGRFSAVGAGTAESQAADVLLDEDEELDDGVLVDDEPEDVLPLSEDLLSEVLPLLAAGALPDEEPRLSVR